MTSPLTDGPQRLDKHPNGGFYWGCSDPEHDKHGNYSEAWGCIQHQRRIEERPGKRLRPMICTHCNQPISKGQPYSRTKRGPHHFRKDQCFLPREFSTLLDQRDFYIKRLELAEKKLAEFGVTWNGDRGYVPEQAVSDGN